MYTELGQCFNKLCYMVEFNHRHEWYFSEKPKAIKAAKDIEKLFPVVLFEVQETEKDGMISKKFTKIDFN